MPVMLYFEWRHKTPNRSADQVRLWIFLLDRNVGFTPIWFGALGYHLWFLGFLFCFFDPLPADLPVAERR